MVWLHKLLAPRAFYRFARITVPWLFIMAVVLLVIGSYAGLALAPPDYQQGDAFRIIYVHVPSAFLSLGIYAVMTAMAVVYLIWRIKLADMFIISAAVIGAWMTFLALVTGAIWGKPMWGTWWLWGDARLTSELILLFIYVGIIALRRAITHPESGAKAVAILVIIGSIDLPIIHYSVHWWNSLHQGATIAKFSKPSIDASMAYPLGFMLAGFACYCMAIILMRTQTLLLKRERKAHWVQEIVT